jgi:hypothetical protein
MAERREFQIEPPCPYQLGLAVEIEEKTRTAIRIVNDHAQEISDKFDEVREHLLAIRNALANRESSEAESDVLMDEDDDALSDSESETHVDGLDDDWGSLPAPEDLLLASDDTSVPEPASACEFDILSKNLEGVESELSCLCQDLNINPSFVLPIWKMWIEAPLGPDVIECLEQNSPVQVWVKICASSMFTPLLTIMQRLFAIPASQAVCERALWRLRRILLPFSVNTSPALALAKLQGVVSFDHTSDCKVMTMKLFSIRTQKSYHLSVYAHETIGDVKNMLDAQYDISGQEILSGKRPGEVFKDSQLIDELDLSLIYRVRDE